MSSRRGSYGDKAVDLEASLQLVRTLVEDQGKLLMSRWASAAPTHYKNRRDFTTAVDIEIERNLKSALREAFPEHGLSGEETEDEKRLSPYQWLIDPIDGTKYYAGMSSLFSISVGLLYEDDPILGVVYLAPSGQCFYANHGGGTYLDGQPLSGPQAGSLSEIIINVDTPATHRLTAPEREWFEERLLRLIRRVYRVRALGIGSVSACWVASGALDAYVDLTGYVKPQDIGAGRIIMAESGLRVEYLDSGVGPRKLLAAAPHLWEELQAVLRD